MLHATANMPWHDVSPATAVVLVVVAAVVLVQYLATRRVALDADIAVQHERQLTPVVCDTAHAPRERPVIQQSAVLALRVCTIRVYWPSVGVRNGKFYGWCLWADPQELVIVVAGQNCGPKLHGVPELECIGSVGYSGASDTLAYLDVQLGATAPHISRIHVNNSVPLAPKPHVSIVLYRPPDAEQLECYVITSARSPQWSPVEQLFAMDPARWMELSLSASDKAPGRGLRQVVVLLNAAKYATGLSNRRQSTMRAVAAVICGHIAHCARSVPGFFQYSAVARLYTTRAKRLGTWTEYDAAMRAVSEWTHGIGPAPDITAAQYAADYSWDAVLVLALDVALGHVLAHSLDAHAEQVSRTLAAAAACVNAATVRATFQWLASWPLGLKLNTELALFLSDTLGSVADGLCFTLPFTVHDVVHALSLQTRTLGICTCLCLASDALLVGTLHLRIMHALIRHVYLFLMRVASSLFDVFRGKKRNPLHGGRVDKAQYDVDQLFLGTLLFTLLVFLFPTVLMYYAACALAQLGVLGAVAVLMTVTAAVDMLPMCKLAHIAHNPLREPTGMQWTHVPRSSMASTRKLESQSLALSSVFKEYTMCLAPVCALPRLAWAAVRGQPLVL